MNLDDLPSREMTAEILRIVADRIRAAGGDRVTIALPDLQLIYSYASAIQRLELDSQQKSSPQELLSNKHQ